MNKKTTEIRSTKPNTIDEGLRNLVINELLNSNPSATVKLAEMLELHGKDATLDSEAKAKIEDAICDALYGEV